MSKKITVYTWTVCSYCDRAKKLLTDKGVEFQEINIDGKDDELKALVEKTGMKTIPQIFIDGNFIGGYRELSAFEATGEFDRLLNT